MQPFSYGLLRTMRPYHACLKGAYKIYCTRIWEHAFQPMLLCTWEISAAGLVTYWVGWPLALDLAYYHAVLPMAGAESRPAANQRTAKKTSVGAPHAQPNAPARQRPTSLAGARLWLCRTGCPWAPRHAPGGPKEGGGRLCRIFFKQPGSSHVTTILCPVAQGS